MSRMGMFDAWVPGHEWYVCAGVPAFWMRSTGRVVLSIGSTHVGDDEALAGMSALERDDALARLARLHRHKIEMADEILVINVGG